MKPLVAFVAAIILLFGPQYVRAQELAPLDQERLKALEAERKKLSERLAEVDADISRLKGGASGERPTPLRYLLPAPPEDKRKTSAPRWELAAPIVDGFSNPNEIVYDEAYLDAYVRWAVNSSIGCGPGIYWVDTPDGLVEVRSGLDEAYLGRRFRADDLVRFLKTRIEGKSVEREIRLGNLDAAQRLRERQESAAGGRLSLSPWERDTLTVVRLLALARYKPAYPLIKALQKDPSLAVRSGAVEALGGMAAAVPEAVKELARLLPDQELGAMAAGGLTAAGGVAVPELVEAMNHQDWTVRNRSVFALARIHPFDAAAPGLLAALSHKEKAIRKWALDVVIDMQGRGVSVARDDLVDVLARRLADDDDESRLKAAIALVNLKGAAARARPALAKAAAEDRGYVVSHYAQQALKAIDAAAPQEK